MRKVRYELLRVADSLPMIEHDSVGGAILRSMVNAPAIATSLTDTFIPPWWSEDILMHGDLILSWGTSNTYPDGGERERYIVERRVYLIERFIVRSQVLDADGYPLKSEAVPVAFNLSYSDALTQRKRFQSERPDLFFDIIPQVRG